jgi:hypothetical protein
VPDGVTELIGTIAFESNGDDPRHLLTAQEGLKSNREAPRA